MIFFFAHVYTFIFFYQQNYLRDISVNTYMFSFSKIGLVIQRFIVVLKMRQCAFWTVPCFSKYDSVWFSLLQYFGFFEHLFNVIINFHDSVILLCTVNKIRSWTNETRSSVQVFRYAKPFTVSCRQNPVSNQLNDSYLNFT